MNGEDVRKIDSEIIAVATALQHSWPDFAKYCQVKLAQCAIAGGISAYNVGNRSVTRDLQFWERALELANRMAAVEAGGMAEQPIYFRSR